MITEQLWLAFDASFGRGQRPVGAHFYVSPDGYGTFLCDLCGFERSVTGHWYNAEGMYGASHGCHPWCAHESHFPPTPKSVQ